MHTRIILPKFYVSFLILMCTLRAFAQGPNEAVKPYGESFTVYIENDTQRLGGPNSDQGYTSGIRFSYVYAEDKSPEWVPSLLGWSDFFLSEEYKKATTNYGISLAQQIYTPDNTDATELIKNDRPYAGWLYLGFTATMKTPTRSHSLEIDLGVVGPEAMGENVQNGFHRVIDVPPARGWDHQLATEPTLQLSYFQKVRTLETMVDGSRTFDLIPYAGASLGNVLIAYHMGAMVRLGVNLPDDFGPSRLSSADGDSILNIHIGNKEYSWRAYGFAGIRGNAVARNIFLDGNTFRDSHRVHKKNFTAETEVGYAVQISHWNYSWRFVTISPEFEEKNEFNSYASISLSYFRDFE